MNIHSSLKPYINIEDKSMYCPLCCKWFKCNSDWNRCPCNKFYVTFDQGLKDLTAIYFYLIIDGRKYQIEQNYYEKDFYIFGLGVGNSKQVIYCPNTVVDFDMENLKDQIQTLIMIS
jgi:hypothetical protein